MESGRALLLIADIGGYTEYMGSHRLSLAHAEATTTRLLWLGRLGRTAGLVGRGLPYMLGLRRRRHTASAH
jgi:hypothetical protein